MKRVDGIEKEGGEMKGKKGEIGKEKVENRMGEIFEMKSRGKRRETKGEKI